MYSYSSFEAKGQDFVFWRGCDKGHSPSYGPRSKRSQSAKDALAAKGRIAIHPPMLLVQCGPPSPRLRYVLNLLLQNILGLEWKWIPPTETPAPDRPLIRYGADGESGLSLPAAPLLEEEGISELEVEYEGAPNYRLRFGDRPFHPLEAAFYVSTRYDRYLSPLLDDHGRYNEKHESLVKEGYTHMPVIHLYAEALWQDLKQLYPDLKRPQRDWSYTISFDIDYPWRFFNRPIVEQVGSMVKSAFQLRLPTFVASLLGIAGIYDPYANYSFPGLKDEHSQYFFLIEKRHHHDGTHTWENGAYREFLFKYFSKANTGIHPSYMSFMNPDQLRAEKEKLEEILRRPVTASRMHFLRYRQPDTFRHLIAVGIEHDYSACPITHTGFIYGMARPFPWFDVERNEETSLMLHPTMAMDRSLQHYMKLRPEAAVDEIERVARITATWKGEFVLLWHNSTMSGLEEWKGWEGVPKEVVKRLERINNQVQNG